MVLKAVVCVAVVLVGVLVTPAFTSRDLTRPQPREWPCPIDTDFYPCLCTNDENYELSIDCSDVQTDQDLSDAFFYAEFPFNHFKEFKIEHDPDDPRMTLTTLDPYTFRTLTFERIIISGTKIEIIQDEDFSNSHDTLTYLNLTSNKITYFPFDAIQGYTKLQNLALDDNQIPVLPHFESDSLEYFSFSGNEGITLSDFTDTPNLREIYMARNKHDALPYQLFWNLLNLTVLDLQRNELLYVDEYYIASQSNALASINLDHNKISFIRHDAFHGLLPDAVVSMKNNSVVDLDEDSWSHLFTQLVPTGTLDLAGNPLRCGCEIDWIMFSSNQIDLSIFTDTTTCISGNQLIFLDVQYFCDRCLPNNCSTT